MVLAILGTPTETTLGPYQLDSSIPYVTLSFPNCAVLTVHWRLVEGSQANFLVRQASAALAVWDCYFAPAPSNATCEQPYCGEMSTGPGPICFETGVSGSCSFTAVQPPYDFGALETPSGIGNLTVSFIVSYLPPLSW